ncbi:tetratricopeptide repeat protein [Undibacterium sp. TJN19]
MAYFEERLQAYRQVIGGWPTRLVSAEQEREIRFLWEKDYAHAASLLQEHAGDIAVQLVLADLLRMGHNIGIADAAKNADALLDTIFQADEVNLKAMLCRASMYVCLQAELMPEAERLFTRLLEITYPYVDPEVYQGLGFACLHQNRNEEAIDYFGKYLKLVPANDKIRELLGKLQAGERGQSTHHADARLLSTKQNTQVFERMKPWWKLW